MNKAEFINKLSKALRGIPESERQDIISDYEEHFNIGIEEGRTEEEISESLGNPNKLSKQLNANFFIDKAGEKNTPGNISRAIFASVGLGFFNLVFVLGPFLAIIGVIIAIWASSIAMVVSGLGLFIGPFIKPIFPDLINIPVNTLISIFLSIGFTGLGLLMCIGSYALTKKFRELTVRYLKMNLSIIRKRQ